MVEKDDERILAEILEQDARYPRQAYFFVLEALQYSVKKFKRKITIEEPQARHITGRELLEGIREFARKEFGMLARCVLREWGITRTEDFGEIVFNMVEHSLLSKTESDSRADFANGYDFHEVFDTYQVSVG